MENSLRNLIKTELMLNTPSYTLENLIRKVIEEGDSTRLMSKSSDSEIDTQKNRISKRKTSKAKAKSKSKSKASAKKKSTSKNTKRKTTEKLSKK
jgi:hypothetical protein